MSEQRFALLIDSDNISAKYISGILDEMAKHGVITYKRIYGDWTSTQTSKWKNQLLENSITPIQQFSNTTGKNATDSALIIDAMDILYTKSVDGFCIVSSDSDFTRLASRLRESGMCVIGMGEEKTPRSFRAACTIFTNLEILTESDEEEVTDDVVQHPVSYKFKNDYRGAEHKSGRQTSGPMDKTIIENDIANIIIENENKGKKTALGEIGNRLVNKYPDFDVRNYGYSLLSKFMDEMSAFTLEKENNNYNVRLNDNEKSDQEIRTAVVSMVQSVGSQGITLNDLSNKLHMKFKHFNVKDYGYSQFLKYIQSFDNLEVKKGQDKRNMVYIKKTRM